MSRRRLLSVIGAVVGASGLAMLVPIIAALVYQEYGDALQIGLAALVTIGAGAAAWRYGRSERHTQLTAREGFAIVGLSWIAMTFFGTLPYIFTGEIVNLTDAFFETAAGYSTTGASIVPDPGMLPKGILLWRALTQWLGGMGIIVLSVWSWRVPNPRGQPRTVSRPDSGRRQSVSGWSTSDSPSLRRCCCGQGT